MTNDRGGFVYPALPVGTYKLTFEAENYKTGAQENIKVNIGSRLRVNATLETGVVGEEIVTITGEAPLIDVKSSDTGMSISKELFNVLPKGRNFTSLVAIAPGANDENNLGSGIMIDGASANENVWVIDGVDVSSIYTGQARSNAVFEFVEEVQVRSGGYDAEFGGSMGGVINVITRSGGNEFHGEGTIYINNAGFNTDSRPSLRLDPQDSDAAEYITYPKDRYSRYEFGGGIGGYVLKDRVWFFGSYMPVFRTNTRNVQWRDSNENITSTEAFEQTQRTHQAAMKVSSQISDSLRVSGSWNTDWYKWMNDLPAVTGHGSKTADYSNNGSLQPGWNMAANADYLITDQLYTNFKFGFHKTDSQGLNEPPGVFHYHLGSGIKAFENNPAYANVPIDYQVPKYYQSTVYGQGGKLIKDVVTKRNLSGDLTYFVEAGGNHMFKGGIQYYRITEDVNNSRPYDYLRLYWDYETPYDNITPGLNRGTYGYYEIRHGHPSGYGTIAEIASNRYALFFQDSWGVTDQLTINVGIRAEKEDIPSFSDLPEYQYPPIQFGFQDKIAPRFGVAYDVFGDGKMKIYGNYAMYYDVMKLEMAEGSYGGFKWISRYHTLDTLEWWTMGGAFTPGGWPKSATQYPGTPIGMRNWRIPSFDTTDPDLKPTAIREFIFGSDYQLSDDIAISARFVHKRLIRTIEDVGVMTPDGEMYYTTNPGFGYSISEATPGSPVCPPAKRHYYGLELRLQKRLSDNWMGGANITLSRLTGNYSGLASTDEQGRQSPNVERYFDWWLLQYDANWNLIDGQLPTDRRYAMKLFGSYVFDFGLTIGMYQNIMDGTPHQTDFTIMSMDGWYPNNRGDMGRSPMMTQTDLYAEYNFNIAEYRAQLSLNISNLFDQDTNNRIYHWYNSNNPGYDEDELIAMYQAGTPFDWRSLATGAHDLNPRYGMEYSYQGARVIRIGMKFIF